MILVSEWQVLCGIYRSDKSCTFGVGATAPIGLAQVERGHFSQWLDTCSLLVVFELASISVAGRVEVDPL